MSNSDVMSGLGLWVYPTIGMVIFMAVFIVAMTRVLGRSRREELSAGGLLPLAHDTFEPGGLTTHTNTSPTRGSARNTEARP